MGVANDNWDSDFLDLVEEAAHLTLGGKSDGKNCLRSRTFSTSATARETVRPRAEFSWKSRDENAPACGREWVMIGTADSLFNHFYIQNGDYSGFVCERG
nr:hypothetical protein [Bradyrhizobium jicamae]